MGLQWINIKTDDSPGSSAAVKQYDLDKNTCIQTLLVTMPALANSTGNATLLTLASLLDQIRITTASGYSQSVIDGEDLYDFQIQALREFPYYNRSATDNARIGLGFMMPLSPFPLDYDRKYGLPKRQGRDITIAWDADPASVDNRTLSIVAVGNPEIDDPLGYLSFVRDAYTGASVGDIRETKVYGKRLLGVHTFSTTSYTDLSASDAADVTTIRAHQLTSSGDSVLGQIQDRALWTYGANKISALIDDGSKFWDLGFQTTGDPCGVDIAGKQLSYQAVFGKTDAARIYPVRLL